VIQRQVRALFESAPTTVDLLFGVSRKAHEPAPPFGSTKRLVTPAITPV
jgi:hypothetical protein